MEKFLIITSMIKNLLLTIRLVNTSVFVTDELDL